LVLTSLKGLLFDIFHHRDKRMSGEGRGGLAHVMHAAASGGDCRQVESLLGRHPQLLEVTNEWGWTPLMQAARGGHRGLVATLVSHGANVNAANKLGNF